MSKITYVTKVTKTSNPDEAQYKVTSGDLNQIKTSVNSLYDVGGWVEYRDTLNTVDNKQSLTASTQNTLTIDGLSTIKTYKPLGMGELDELWEDDKITPLALGDSYQIRVDFNGQIDNNTGYFDLGIYIGGSIGYALQDTYTFPKGANTAHRFSLNFMIYCLDTFVANGGLIHINPSHTMLVWDKRVIITRLTSAV